MINWTEFFKQGSEELSQLRLFGFEHVTILILTAAAVIFIFKFREKLSQISESVKRRICRITAVILFVNMMIFYGVFIVQGVYDWHIHLPFHLCFLTNFAFIYTLITQNKKLFKIVYFFTWIGPLPAMIFPNTEMRFDRFQTWHFVISHHFMFVFGIFCLCVMGWNVAVSDAVKAFFTGNIIFAVIFVFNTICGTNYIMTGNLPQHIIELIPFLRYLDIPILWLEVCGALGMGAACIPLYIKNDSKGESQLYSMKTAGK